jgi:hypothetical protein
MLPLLPLLLALNAETRGIPPRREAAPRAVTACALVTRAEVEAATARRVSSGREERDGALSTCEYAAEGGLVSVSVQPLAAKPDLRAEMAAMKKEIPEATVRVAENLSAAFYVDVPGAGTQLHVIDGSSSHVMVSILGFGEAPQVSGAAAQLARKALRRL